MSEPLILLSRIGSFSRAYTKIVSEQKVWQRVIAETEAHAIYYLNATPSIGSIIIHFE